MAQNLKRNINLGFRVTEDEKAQIYQRMEEVGIRSLRAYLLKMALNGYVINLDLKDVQECTRLLRNVSNNVNQIAKRLNSGGQASAVELAGVQKQLAEIWEQQNKIIRGVSDFMEAA